MLEINVLKLPTKGPMYGVWCTNCGRHGHLPSECSSSITNKRKKCSYCGGKGHDITTCWNISEVRTVVTDNNNQSWP
jgi:hypothetical protein